MTDNSEIPCSSCSSWNQKAKTFACNPNSCNKLSKWLMEHVKIGCMDTLDVEKPQVQYIV